MRLPKLNINAPHDWKGDLSIGISALRRLAAFCVLVLAVTAALLPVYQSAARNSQPFDVYSAEDWQVAVQDPFVDTVILHEDIRLTGIPDRKITVITDF